ncbi:ricin-type beta-trefoil lectin domain protein [Streptomyces sp. NPDC048521]|uniref:RICIN domain-containing protein n=1 Tax=Streptomyces sp. NPDC048521 TaxID=3365566 RepID=UPI00371F575B
MQSPYPPRPPYPPLPGPAGESDRDLVARLGGPHIAHHHAVAVLLARHWHAARDYAIVCLASAGPTADLVATAAFHQVLGRMAGAAVGGALRPQLLTAVRATVRAWATDERTCATLPELRKTTGGRGLSATQPGTPERRLLAERAFRALSGASQCLLWHTEVEAEPINIPAGLLGLDVATATAALEQAREQFRTGCVRAHRELAPSPECRFHTRLLDVPLRRGGTLLPDVRRHLTACRHCRYAAEQLARFDGSLELLLAETVLGWGARRYLDARPGRATPGQGASPEAAETAPLTARGRHRTGAESRRRSAVAVGAGLTSLALLATVLVARSWSDGNGVRVAGATWGAPAGHATRPSGTGARPATSPSAVPVGGPVEVAHGRLRGLASGLCLDLHGGEAAAGVGVRLADCSSAASQQWSYQDDGLLRSAAAPSLCLATDPGTKTVVVDGCVVHAGEVSYDFTVRGEILIRRHNRLVLTPGSGGSTARVGVAARDGSSRQRWVLEPGAGGLPHSDAGPGSSDTPDGREPAPPQRDGAGRAPEGSRPGDTAHGTPRGEGESPGEYDETPRVARIRAEGEQRQGAPAAPGDLVDAVGDLVTPGRRRARPTGHRRRTAAGRDRLHVGRGGVAARLTRQGDSRDEKGPPAGRPLSRGAPAEETAATGRSQRAGRPLSMGTPARGLRGAALTPHARGVMRRARAGGLGGRLCGTGGWGGSAVIV